MNLEDICLVLSVKAAHEIETNVDISLAGVSVRSAKHNSYERFSDYIKHIWMNSAQEF